MTIIDHNGFSSMTEVVEVGGKARALRGHINRRIICEDNCQELQPPYWKERQ